MSQITPAPPIAPPTESQCGRHQWSHTLIGVLLGLGISLAACWPSRIGPKALIIVSSGVGGGIFGYLMSCCRRPTHSTTPRRMDPPPQSPAPLPLPVEPTIPPPQPQPVVPTPQPPESVLLPVEPAPSPQPQPVQTAITPPAPQLRPEADDFILSCILRDMYVRFSIDSWQGQLREGEPDHPGYRQLLDNLRHLRQQTFPDTQEAMHIFESLATLDLQDRDIRDYRELLFTPVQPSEPHPYGHPTSERLVNGLLCIANNRDETGVLGHSAETRRNALTLLDSLVNPFTRALYMKGLLEGDFSALSAISLPSTPHRAVPLALRPEIATLGSQPQTLRPLRHLLSRWFSHWQEQPRLSDQNNEPYREMIRRLHTFTEIHTGHNLHQRMHVAMQQLCEPLCQLLPAEQDHALALLQEIFCQGTEARNYPSELLPLAAHFRSELGSLPAAPAATSLLQGLPSPQLKQPLS
jgi:hypothetical protein